jgi:hypothetical protein
MSNAIYDKGRQAFLEGGVAWLTDNIKAVLVDSGQYTVNPATHQFLSDIAAGARIATSGNLGTKTSTSGVAGAANVTWPAVTGVQSEYIILYKDTGTATTSALLAFIDTATGLPVTPNGGDITVTWDTGANKIFKL